MAKVPSGRSLVESFKDRKFAFVGVNTDAPSSDLAERTKSKDIPWRSFADGGPSGPISSAWGVAAFPTAFLIDHKGIVRGVDIDDDALPAEIERLLAAAKKP